MARAKKITHRSPTKAIDTLYDMLDDPKLDAKTRANIAVNLLPLERGVPSKRDRLGKKELAKLEAERVGVGRFATPPGPSPSKIDDAPVSVSSRFATPPPPPKHLDPDGRKKH
jgi:hypothetical protein